MTSESKVENLLLHEGDWWLAVKLASRLPALRWHDLYPGFCGELESILRGSVRAGG